VTQTSKDRTQTNNRLYRKAIVRRIVEKEAYASNENKKSIHPNVTENETKRTQRIKRETRTREIMDSEVVINICIYIHLDKYMRRTPIHVQDSLMYTRQGVQRNRVIPSPHEG